MAFPTPPMNFIDTVTRHLVTPLPFARERTGSDSWREFVASPLEASA